MPAPCHASPAPSSDQLNADITHEEVEAALKRLKRNKVAGVDGIKAEFILDAADLLITPLVLTFNQILDKGVPPSWCIGLIHVLVLSSLQMTDLAPTFVGCQTSVICITSLTALKMMVR